MFNLDRVHIILDEMIQNGHVVETNKSRILAPLTALDKMADSWGSRSSESDVRGHRIRLNWTVLKGTLINISMSTT